MVLLVNAIKHLKENTNPFQILPNKKTEEERTFPNSFYKPSVNPDTKPDKGCHKKKIIYLKVTRKAYKMSEWPDNLLRNDFTNISRCLLIEEPKIPLLLPFFGLV